MLEHMTSLKWMWSAVTLLEESLPQMEPVAHFGLGGEMPVKLEVLFPDGRWMTKELTSTDVNRTLKVKYSKSQSSLSISNNFVSKSRSKLLESTVGKNWKAMELKSTASKINPRELKLALLVMFLFTRFH